MYEIINTYFLQYQELTLPEQQEYVNQVALLHKKLIHLEETLKIEAEEGKLQKKMEFHHVNSIKQADLLSRKKEEQKAQQVQLQEEEGTRHCIIEEMVKNTDDSLAPIKNVLVHFEGKCN